MDISSVVDDTVIKIFLGNTVARQSMSIWNVHSEVFGDGLLFETYFL